MPFALKETSNSVFGTDIVMSPCKLIPETENEPTEAVPSHEVISGVTVPVVDIVG